MNSIPRLVLLLGLCFATAVAGRAAETSPDNVAMINREGGIPQTGAELPGGDLVSNAECNGPYRILSFVKVAAALQALPEKERIAQLRAWAARCGEHGIYFADPLDEQVRYLCRLLFEKKGGGSLRQAGVGGPMFVGTDRGLGLSMGPETKAVYPDEPFLFVGDVPFLVARGYIFAGGVPESGARYLEMCLKDGQWTHRRYDQVTPDVIARALHTLLENHAWPNALTLADEKFLTEQTLPYEAPGLWAEVEASSRSGMRSISFKKEDFKPKGSLLLHEWDQLAVDVWGGTRPYRYTIRLETAGGPEIGGGRGRADLANPFQWEEFPVPRAGLAVGTVIVFEVTDAKGTRLTQRIRVSSPKSLEVDKPDVTPGKAD